MNPYAAQTLETRSCYYYLKKINNEDKLKRISDLCKKKGFIVRKDIEENLNVSQAAAVILLRGLVERQILIKQGKARNTRYYLKNKQD